MMKYFVPFVIVAMLVSHCQGQVVQLPAVGSFGVNTTVSVPDQGTASLGGVGRSSYGTTTRGAGPLASSARGGTSSATSASITAIVIDLAAMDEAILSMPAGSTNVANYATRNQGTKIVTTLTPHNYAREIKRHAAPAHPLDWMMALGSPGNDRNDSAENNVRDGSNVRYFMEKAAAAHALGRGAAARVYYQMAIDRMTPEQRARMAEIQANRLAEANGKSKKVIQETKSPATATAVPSVESNSNASPFDPPTPPVGEVDAMPDMNGSPF